MLFGEAFAIYPWMLDRDYEHIIGNTPAILGMHEVTKFRGQSSPALFRTQLDVSDLDQPLLTELLARWQRRYKASQPQWEDIALFRSLNMAYHASLLPAASEATFYDVGRLVSLWVSAFEILVHPGGTGQANRDKVFSLIEKTPWKGVMWPSDLTRQAERQKLNGLSQHGFIRRCMSVETTFCMATQWTGVI